MSVKLSEKQLEDLRKLHKDLKHPKLKKLLKRAVKTWETTEVRANSFGVYQSNKKIKKDSDWVNHGYTKPLWYVSGFSEKEFEVIHKTFDAYHQQTDQVLYNLYKDNVKNLKLLINEISQIRNICFGH